MWWEWKLTFSFQISPQRLLQGDNHAGNIKRPHNAMAYSSNPPITKWTLTINAASDTRECKRRWLARCWTPSSSWKLQTEAGWKVNNSRNTFSWDIRRPSENWPNGDQMSGGEQFLPFSLPLWSNDLLIKQFSDQVKSGQIIVVSHLILLSDNNCIRGWKRDTKTRKVLLCHHQI